MRRVQSPHTSKQLMENGPVWAGGCPKCSANIVGIGISPELTRVVPLYLERIIQLLDGELVCCDCRAGAAYEASLRNRYQALVEEGRSNPYLVSGSHPELMGARNAMRAARAYDTRTKVSVEPDPAPTVHFAGEPVLA